MINKETFSIIFTKNYTPIFLSYFSYIFWPECLSDARSTLTVMLDQDIKMIYNSLLISSGFEQAYRDHPAYTTFLFLVDF